MSVWLVLSFCYLSELQDEIVYPHKYSTLTDLYMDIFPWLGALPAVFIDKRLPSIYRQQDSNTFLLALQN